MAGNRPLLSINAKSKKAPKDARRAFVISVWKSDYNDGYRVSLDKDVACIELKDGTRITAGKDGSHYLDCFVNQRLEPTPSADERKQQRTDSAALKDDSLAARVADEDTSGFRDEPPRNQTKYATVREDDQTAFSDDDIPF